MEIEIKFGQNLKQLRIMNAMTQVGLGKLLYVSEASIRDWENRGIEPSYITLCKIAKIFDVTVGELLGVED